MTGDQAFAALMGFTIGLAVVGLLYLLNMLP